MKKRGYLFLMCFLLALLVHNVNAAITIEGPEISTVNLGDQIKITGSITETKDVLGQLTFTLQCATTTPLAVKSINLKANSKKIFTETFTINEKRDGSCAINIALESNNAVLDKADSSSFSISDELKASASIDKTQVQLGDSITITGEAAQLDDTAVNGFAKIALRQKNTLVVQETIPIAKGKFSYTYDTKDNPPGNYEIEIEVTDTFKNHKTIILSNLIIAGDIVITPTFNSLELLPDEKIKIDGTAKRGDERVTKGTAYITFDNQREEATILLGFFKHAILLPATITTGKHHIIMEAEDSYGNRGVVEQDIFVKAVPTRLEIIGNQPSFAPEKQVVLKASLFDQADELIAADIHLKVYDTDNDLVFEDTIPSSQQTQFTLPRTAVPGSWNLEAEALDVDTAMEFNIEELRTLDITQAGETLAFKNTGNVKYKEKINILFTDTTNPEKTIAKQKKISLKVGQSETVDLAYWAGKGIYTVTVQEKTFNDVAIPKKKIHWQPYLAGILGIIIIFFCVKLIRTILPERRRHHLRRIHKQREQKHHTSQQTIKRHRTEEYYERKLKKDFAERLEAKKGIFKFNVKKQKDEYIMEMPQKKIRSTAASSYSAPEKQEEVISNTTDFFDPWRDEPVEQKPDSSKPKKGNSIFNMFD